MDFECKTVSLSRPILNSEGAMQPLCNTCTQVDCNNPIRKKKISIFGKMEEWQVYMVGSQAYQVVQCTGYQD